MSWISRGLQRKGYVQEAPDGQTATVPAVTAHRGELWCLWSDPSGELYYAVGNNSIFGPRVLFPDRGIPVMAELLGMLHALVVQETGDIVHYLFDDITQKWPVITVLDRQAGHYTDTTPAMVAFHNRLFLVYIQESNLMYTIWDMKTQTWKLPQQVNGITQVAGIPAAFILDGVLHVLCASHEESREILGFKYESLEDVWNSCDDVSEGKAASGVSATSYGDSAYLAFQENGPGDTSGAIYVAEYVNGKWEPQQPVAGQASADPPQLAVLNGRLNCIFNSNDEKRELTWYSRPVLNYSLSSWMADIPDDTLLSSITIPGTHDSCARSNIPFVRTQYLSISKQMEAGLRFLDLRCRVHDDGDLYMYHGGIPIDLPFYLKLSSVMKEIFDFMQKDGSEPSETVLISINNDDTSGKEPPAVFYKAVKTHIDQTARYQDGTERWITSRTTVTLGEARGRCVLLRRYQPDPALEASERIGIDLSGWLNNNPDFTLQTTDGIIATLQDKWQYSNIVPLAELIESKFGFVSNMLSKAASASPEEWFLNFMSAVGDPVEHGEVAESHWIAVGGHSDFIGKFVPGMNVVVRRKYEWDVKRRYGVIAMDYPELPKDSDLIAWLISTNM